VKTNLGWLAISVLGFMVACGQSQTPISTMAHGSRALGTIEISFDPSAKTASAQFKSISPGGSQTKTVLDETQFTFSPSSFQSIQTGTRNYFNARFNIKNASAATVNNLTLVAYVKTGNQAQTAINNAQDFAGGSLNLDAFVQDIRPTHGSNNDASVNSSLADLMLFTETETASLLVEAQTANVLQAGEYLLPYGFVARNATDTRDITVDPATATGGVNIGLSVPTGNEPSAAAYRFTMTFAVFENPTGTTRVVESLEEQTNSAGAVARVAQVGANEVALLQGSSYPTGTAATLKLLCDVRTAGAAGAATAVLVPSQSLAVGQVANVAGTGAGLVCVKNADASAAEYIAIPANLASTGNQSITVTSADTVAPVAPLAVGTDTTMRLSSQGLDQGNLQESRQGLVNENLNALLRNPNSRIRSSQSRAGLLRPQAITPGVPTIGDQMTLNVAQGCTGTLDLRTGTVKLVTSHLIIVADNANPAGGFTDHNYATIAQTPVSPDVINTSTGDSSFAFEENVYPAINAAFGAPADTDTNGRVIAFFTRAVNELSPPASSVVINGYFDRRDLFTDDPVSGCSRSNKGEILYMLVPDPTGAVNSNVRTVSFVAGSVARTLGAEYSRLINASRRTYITNASAYEEAWLEDGLASISEELMFYQNSVGLSPLGNIVVSNLTTGPNASKRVAAFNTFANQNYGRHRGFLQRPDIRSLFTIGTTADGLGGRGAIWNFLRYAADRKISSGSQSGFWSGLVDANLTGRANLQAAIGDDLNVWIRDWSSAIYADDFVTGIASNLTAASWNYRSLFTALNGSFQLVTRSLSAGVPLTLSIVSGGSSHDRFGVASGQTATLMTRTSNNAPASTTSLTLLRVR
jgi:hypothetical protein